MQVERRLRAAARRLSVGPDVVEDARLTLSAAREARLAWEERVLVGAAVLWACSVLGYARGARDVALAVGAPRRAVSACMKEMVRVSLRTSAQGGAG